MEYSRDGDGSLRLDIYLFFLINKIFEFLYHVGVVCEGLLDA